MDFRRDILPKLQRLPVRVIADAMGASISHGSKVRSGLLVPHRRHWSSLFKLKGGAEARKSCQDGDRGDLGGLVERR